MLYKSIKSNLKELNKLAIPLIIQNIAGLLMGLLDQIFIGHISPEAYGAVGIAVSLMNFTAGAFGYFAVAFNIMGAKKSGENDASAFREVLMTSLLIDLAIGVVYGILSIGCCRFVYGYFYKLSGTALSTAVLYTYITAPYMLFQLVIFTMSAYYKIKKNTSKLMVISVAASVLNVVLDYCLIYGKFGLPKLDAAGAALGTIIGVFINALLLVVYAAGEIKFYVSRLGAYARNALELVKQSLPLLGEELLEGSVFVVVINAILSSMGIMEIGGYLLVKNLLDIVMISMYMYGSAELTLVSELCGAGKYKEIQPLTRTGVFISMAVFFVLSVVLILLRADMPRLISDDAALIRYASMLILPMCLMNLFNPVQTIYKYVLQACGDGTFVLYGTAIVNALVLGMILVLHWGSAGVYAVVVGLFFNYLVLSVMYHIRLQKVLEKKNG